MVYYFNINLLLLCCSYLHARITHIMHTPDRRSQNRHLSTCLFGDRAFALTYENTCISYCKHHILSHLTLYSVISDLLDPHIAGRYNNSYMHECAQLWLSTPQLVIPQSVDRMQIHTYRAIRLLFTEPGSADL